jgi:predicted nuclease with TOPRIM domain
LPALHARVIVPGAHIFKERNVNTSKYDPATRHQLKRFQRSSAYSAMKQHFTEERTKLETKLRERNEAIDRLKKKLEAAGIPLEEIAKLAA